MKLYCIGDSITFGFGVSPAQRWTRIAAELTGIEIVNLGVNGDTTGGMLARLAELCSKEALSGSIVMVSGGGNDVFFSGTDSAARANFAAMTQQLLACGAYPLVGLTTPIFPERCRKAWSGFVDYENAAEKLDALRDWLSGYCEAFGIDSFDFADALTDGSGKVRSELFPDGLHPGAEGHTLIAQALACRLLELEERLHG